MKSEHITPCIEAVVDTFDNMLNVTPERTGKLSLQLGLDKLKGVLALIGLSGTMKGAMVLNLEENVACKIVTAFAGTEMETVNDDVLDGIAELVNIIAGAAAGRLTEYKIKLGLPTVDLGGAKLVLGKGTPPCVQIPMYAEGIGSFNILIVLDKG